MELLRSALALALVAFAIVQYPLLWQELPYFNRFYRHLGAVISLSHPTVKLGQGVVYGERTAWFSNPNTAIERFLGKTILLWHLISFLTVDIDQGFPLRCPLLEISDLTHLEHSPMIHIG
jgi:hypothetical protein